jgi:ribosomal protein L34E
MGAHVFVVDKFSFPVHRSRGFCGVKNPYDERSRLSLYADLGNIRIGDIVFFYQRRIDEPRLERGFRGIFRVVSDPFFDYTDVNYGGNVVRGKCPYCGSSYSEKQENDSVKCPICKCELNSSEHILPNRVLIQPLEYYEQPVDDNTAYINHTNHGVLWTMLFRKVFGPGRERSVSPILPEECEKLQRLLKKVNDNKTATFDFHPYYPNKQVPLKIELGPGPKVPYEDTLIAWMTRNIDKNYPVLGEIISKEELEFFGNQILYGIGGEKVDFLCLHKRDDKRYKATVIEAKKDVVGEEAIEKITDYAYWIAQLSTANLSYTIERFQIQPVLIGFRFTQNARSSIMKTKERKVSIPYGTHLCDVTVQRPIIVTYRVSDGSIRFNIENLSTMLSYF